MDIDEVREDRIIKEVLSDTYEEVERGTNWYYYLSDRLNFPFAANWLTRNSSTKVKVVGMPSVIDCLEDMLVNIFYYPLGKDVSAISLRQIQPFSEDAATL